MKVVALKRAIITSPDQSTTSIHEKFSTRQKKRKRTNSSSQQRLRRIFPCSKSQNTTINRTDPLIIVKNDVWFSFLNGSLFSGETERALIISRRTQAWRDALSRAIGIHQMVRFLQFPEMTLDETYSVNRVRVDNSMGYLTKVENVQGIQTFYSKSR